MLLYKALKEAIKQGSVNNYFRNTNYFELIITINVFFFKGAIPDTQWQRAISERGEVVCPTCSIVTRKTVHGLKKHMEICQKVCGCS